MSGYSRNFDKQVKEGKCLSKKDRPTKKHSSHKEPDTLRDVTLEDFANSKVIKGRLGKAKSSSTVVREIKHLNIDDKAWDEKLDEFEGDFDFVTELNEDGEEVIVMKKATRGRKTLGDSILEGNNQAKTYHVDIWHLIAKYLRPEDTTTFACICKTTWSVVNTTSFWVNLYKRYYKDVPDLPERLRPECMVRHHGLRACVVRSLFYMYPPLASRVDSGYSNTPYKLRSRQCVSVWQQKLASNKWRLSFKMRRKDCTPTRPSGDLMTILDDIFANVEDGCAVLQVVSTEKTLASNVMGLTLHSIQISSKIQKLLSMHVQMVFGSGIIANGNLDTMNTVTLSLNTVQQVCVLDWWHPRYPHSSTLIRLPEDT